MEAILKAGDVALPSPVSLSIDDEIIWSADTGRTMDGAMTGDVIAEKKALNIAWGYLLEEELILIKSYLVSGFFPITFHDDGIDMSIEVYRGTLSKTYAGYFGNEHWYSSATVKIVEV